METEIDFNIQKIPYVPLYLYFVIYNRFRKSQRTHLVDNFSIIARLIVDTKNASIIRSGSEILKVCYHEKPVVYPVGIQHFIYKC